MTSPVSLFTWVNHRGELNVLCLQHVTCATWEDELSDDDNARALYVCTTDSEIQVGDGAADCVLFRGEEATRFLHALTTFHETVVSR